MSGETWVPTPHLRIVKRIINRDGDFDILWQQQWITRWDESGVLAGACHSGEGYGGKPNSRGEWRDIQTVVEEYEEPDPDDESGN